MAGTPSPMTPAVAHERERHDLLAAEAQHHLDNVRAEANRYEEAVAHIERVYTMRMEALHNH